MKVFKYKYFSLCKLKYFQIQIYVFEPDAHTLTVHKNKTKTHS